MVPVKLMPVRVTGESPALGYFEFSHIEQGKRGPIAIVYEIERLKRGDGSIYWKRGKGRAFYAHRVRVLCGACTSRVDAHRLPKRDCTNCELLEVDA